jgi:PAS domain S-box-containing protein
MEDNLNILLLEDSQEDADLIEREIKRAGIPATLSVVDTNKDFEHLLNTSIPDVILCDHSMPDFNSFDALNIFQAHRIKNSKRIPFIIVTGTLTDDVASFCLQAGADDYVLKDRLRRLPGAIRIALDKCEIENERADYLYKARAYEASMKEAELIARFGTWKADLDTGEAQWSDGSFRIYGYEPGEAKPGYELFMKHVHPDDNERVGSEIGKVIGTKMSNEFEFRIVTRHGEVRHIFNRITIQSNKGSKGILVGFNYDITDRKLAENRLLETYRVAQIGGWEFDLIRGNTLSSDVTREIFEVDPAFVVENLKDVIAFYKEGESRDQITMAIENCIHRDTPWDLELQIITAKGNERWIRTIGKGQKKSGKCVRLYGSIQDVDVRKRAQINLELQNQKLMEIAWMQSHEVREPLSSLIGLIDTLTGQKYEGPEREDLLKKAAGSAKELDQIVRKIIAMAEGLKEQ